MEKSEASLFHIEREKGSNYFIITSSSNPILHLSASVDSHGYASSLQLRSDANAWYHLAIHDRLSHVQSKQLQPEDPSKWPGGSEIFYVSCYTKPAVSKKASYLCVHRKTPEEYSTGSVPSIKENLKSDVSILFQLVSKNQEPVRENTEHPTESGQQGSKPGEGVKNRESPMRLEIDADVHPQPNQSERNAEDVV